MARCLVLESNEEIGVSYEILPSQEGRGLPALGSPGDVRAGIKSFFDASCFVLSLTHTRVSVTFGIWEPTLDSFCLGRDCL